MQNVTAGSESNMNHVFVSRVFWVELFINYFIFCRAEPQSAKCEQKKKIDSGCESHKASNWPFISLFNHLFSILVRLIKCDAKPNQIK